MGRGIRAPVGSVGRGPWPPGLSVPLSTPVLHEQGAGGCTACATHPQPPALATWLGCSCPIPRRGPHAGTGTFSLVWAAPGLAKCVLRGGLPHSSPCLFSAKRGAREGSGSSSRTCPEPDRFCPGWALGIPILPGCKWETSKKRGLWGKRAARGVLWHPDTMPICINNCRAVRGTEAASQARALAGGSRGMPTLPPRLQQQSRSQHRFLSSRTCGQRPDSNLLLAPTPVLWCQPLGRVPALPQEALAAVALVLQLGWLRAHRLLWAAVHPGKGRVPALGCLERQQCLPHRAPDVLPPRLLRCECPVMALVPSKCPGQQHQFKAERSGRASTALPGALRVAGAPHGGLSSSPTMPSRICSFPPVL